MDSVYLLIVRLKIEGTGSADSKSHNMSVELQWRGPKGYLGAVDYPLLTFYG